MLSSPSGKLWFTFFRKISNDDGGNIVGGFCDGWQSCRFGQGLFPVNYYCTEEFCLLQVLIGKTKVEGEDALRKLVAALNGLAGIAMIKQDYKEAVSLYKEALFIVEEHSDDFRLDPLLNIHIHHNLSEVLPLSVDSLPDNSVSGRSEELTMTCHIDKKENNAMKKGRLIRDDSSLTSDNAPQISSCLLKNDENCYDDRPHLSTNIQRSRTACEDLKQKYLSVFYVKLSTAQQEFRKSHEQV